MSESVFIHSDWGGDVFQLASILVARPQEFKILGASVTFGNATHDQNLLNAGALLRLLKIDARVPLYPGSKAPLGKTAPPQGDGAHGTDGLGGVKLPFSDYPPEDTQAADVILETLKREPSGTVTLISTGPQTDVAKAIQKDPETMKRVKEIRIMGGCLRPMPGYDVTWPDLKRIAPMNRQGNITPFAEFNFQQDPIAAKAVLDSGLPIALFPMDCTHQTTYGQKEQAMLARSMINNQALFNIIHNLTDAPKKMDRAKFDIYSVTHDKSTTVSMVRPDLYEGEQGFVEINTDPESKRFGQTTFRPNKEGNIWAAQTVTDPKAVFTEYISALSTIFAPDLRPKADPGLRA